MHFHTWAVELMWIVQYTSFTMFDTQVFEGTLDTYPMHIEIFPSVNDKMKGDSGDVVRAIKEARPVLHGG